MKNLLFVCLLLLAPQMLMAEDNASDEAQLRELKTKLWQQAYRQGDAQLLDKILHESFEFVQNDGSISTKAKELKAVAASKWNPKSFRYEIKRLKVYQGKFAVVSGVGHAETQSGVRYLYHSSNHLVKQEGRWQAVSSHVSGYQELEAPEKGLNKKAK